MMRLGALSFLIALTLVLSLWLGPAHVALSDLLSDGARARAIVWEIRFPRALTALCVGAGLGLAGAGLQGLLRNPLAEGGVLGLSGFSALGAVIAFAFGFAAFAPALAIVFALGAAAGVVALGAHARGPASLILIGVGLSSLAGGLIALTLNLAPNPGALADLVNWTLGSVEARGMDDAGLTGGCVALGAALLWLSGRGLQALTLGEEAAASLGADIARTRLLAIAGAALCIGGATATAGIIGFVGIAAPHLARMMWGHDPKRILAPSAALGAAIVLFADVMVRVLPTDTELKLGVAAALLGGPVFALLAARLAKRSEA